METSALVALAGTSLAIACLRPISTKLKLVDLPDHRKQHIGEIPLIGGLAICMGMLLSALTTLDLSFPIAALLTASVAVALMGAMDDAKDLCAWARLGVQMLIILALCLSTQVGLHQFGDLLGLGNIHLPAMNSSVIGSFFAILIAILAVCAAINAYNMMDGIDGLAGSMVGVSLLGLAILFAGVHTPISQFCLMLIFALVPYLMANLRIPPFKKKIFMGDAGSMMLGLIIGYLVLFGSQQTSAANAFRPVAALWLIGLPLMDMVGIMIRRMRKGQSPLKADRNHLHHILLNAGFTSRETLLLMVVANLGIVFFGIIAEQAKLPEWLMMVLYLSVFASYCVALNKAGKIKRWVKKDKALNRVIPPENL